MIKADISSVLHTKIPGVFLNNVIFDKQNDTYSLSIKFNTKLVTTLTKNVGYYFGGDGFNNDYKIAIFYSNQRLSSLDLSSIHQQRFSSLFTKAQKEEDVFLLNILNLSNADDFPENKTKGSLLKTYEHRYLNGGTVVFDLPFTTQATVPMSSDLSLFVVPYLSNTSHVAASGVGNGVFEEPYYVGTAIGEDVLINGNVNPKRTYFANRNTGHEVANELVANYDTYRNKRVVPFRELQDISVISSMNSKLITSEDTYTSDTSTNKNYFSRLTLSRDRDERVRGLFGLDVLSLVRDNFPQSRILNNSSLQVVRKFMNSVKVQILYPTERIANTRRVTSNIIARKIPVSVSEQPTLEQNLRLQDPFIQHYSFICTNPNRSLRNEYEYNLRVRVDISNIYKKTMSELHNVRQLLYRMRGVLANYDLNNKRKDKVSTIFNQITTDRVFNYFLTYSSEPISSQEAQDHRRRLANLGHTKSGAQKILDFMYNIEDVLLAITNSLKPGSTKKDPLATGGFPSNHNAGSVNHSFIIEHTFKETFKASDNPLGFGADYIHHVLSPQRQTNPILSVYSAEQYQSRIFVEERKNLLSFPPFADDVSNMTNEIYDQALNLDLQRLSFLSPHSIKTGITVSAEPLTNDAITRLTTSDYNKYDYYLLNYLMSAAVQNQKLNPNLAYRVPVFANPHLNDPIFVTRHLLKYFSLTKNTGVLQLYRDIKAQNEKKKNSFDTDDTSSSKSPDTNEPLTDNIEEINPKDILVSILSTEIMSDKTPFDPMGLYHLPQLAKDASYQQFSSLPNQIKALIKYYDYIAEQAIASYQPMQENLIPDKEKQVIINKLAQEDQVSTSGYIYTNFLNIKEVQVFQGYELTEKNEVLMNKPVYSKLQSYDQLSRGRLTLCKLVDYKNLKFNIPETGYFPTYNEHFFISGNISSPTAPATGPVTTGPATPSPSPAPTTPSPAPSAPATGGSGY